MKDKEQAPHANGVDTSTAQDRGMAEVWQEDAKVAVQGVGRVYRVDPPGPR